MTSARDGSKEWRVQEGGSKEWRVRWWKGVASPSVLECKRKMRKREVEGG